MYSKFGNNNNKRLRSLVKNTIISGNIYMHSNRWMWCWLVIASQWYVYISAKLAILRLQSIFIVCNYGCCLISVLASLPEVSQPACRQLSNGYIFFDILLNGWAAILELFYCFVIAHSNNATQAHTRYNLPSLAQTLS